VALVRQDYEDVLTLTAQGLAAPHDATMEWQMRLFAGNACFQLGRFADAVAHFEAAVDGNPDESMNATIRGDMADAKLTEALRTRTPMSETELAQVRAWIDATPPAPAPASPALQHRNAMLRLLENDPVAAVSLCETSLASLEARPGDHPLSHWQLVAATLVIANARSGRPDRAVELQAQLATDAWLYAAAAAELAADVSDSAPDA
jgi:hypothetical protein